MWHTHTSYEFRKHNSIYNIKIYEYNEIDILKDDMLKTLLKAIFKTHKYKKRNVPHSWMG